MANNMMKYATANCIMWKSARMPCCKRLGRNCCGICLVVT